MDHHVIDGSVPQNEHTTFRAVQHSMGREIQNGDPQWNDMSIFSYDMNKLMPPHVYISMDTLEGTHQLFEDEPASLREIWARQNDNLASELTRESEIAMPPDIKPGDFIATPLDIMAYHNAMNRQLEFTCLEFNSLAYAGVFNLPPSVLRGIQYTLNKFGNEFSQDTNAIILVGCSGRQQAKDTSNPDVREGSTIIYEKIWLADAIAQGINTGVGAGRKLSSL